MDAVSGVHHVTAISTDPQRTLDFYAGTLGMRFVKRTVNFDDPRTYHFYFADAAGSPGTVLTFFPWPGAARGRIGVGQVAMTTVAAPPGSLGFWEDRLGRAGVTVARDTPDVLRFADFDGLALALVEADPEAVVPWEADPEIGAHALRGFHSVTLWTGTLERTSSVLEDVLGLRPDPSDAPHARDDERRYSSEGTGPGTHVAVRSDAGPRALGGAGTVHHVAFRAADERHQAALRERALAAGLAPTPVIDRSYFRSVYFREPGGILFEIATDAPGFLIDEPADALGESLRLPSNYEAAREDIERVLPPIRVPRASDPSPPFGGVPGSGDPSPPSGGVVPRASDPSPPAGAIPGAIASSILDAWPHVWEPPPEPGDGPILLLLHGTGGDERDLLTLGRSLHPGAGLLSPRGRVVEGGMPRFFRRERPGVFDLDDMWARAEELAVFVEEAARVYGFDAARVVAVGFSNGANIATAVMFRRPGLLAAAILLSPMLPYDPGPPADLSGTAVFVGAGRRDPIAPAEQVELLAELLRSGGARVSIHWDPGGHSVTPDELDAARRWLTDYIQGSSAVGP